MKFKSYATVKSFSQAIQRTGEAYLSPTEHTDVSLDKKIRLERQGNVMAIVEQSETSDWPSGLAHTIVDELFKKYMADDIISRVELRSKLNKVAMKAENDPRTLSYQLASLSRALITTPLGR
jgi:hypothetical protein